MHSPLPVHWYFDTDHYHKERESIFAANWTLYCPEHELHEPGTYKAERVNGWELLVVRAKSGELQGFHNTCRHRGTMLKKPGTGKCNLLVCPYHAWSYQLDGSLVRTPGFDGLPGFDKKDYGLRPIRVDTWAGLVFVCIDEAAPGLLSWLGSLPNLCRLLASPESLVYYDRFSIKARQNWKLFCENTVEGYHLSTVHKDLSNMVDMDESTISDYDDGALVVFHVTYKTDGIGKRGRTGIWWYRFPGFQGVCSVKNFRADRIEPMGPGKSRIVDWSWNASDMTEEECAEGFRFARQIVAEDIGPCESIQRNMRSGAFSQGVFSPTSEKHITGFQERVKEALEASGDG